MPFPAMRYQELIIDNSGWIQYTISMVTDTKLQQPQLKPGLLPRTALLRSIRDNLNHRVVIVCAGPGYGKSTVLAQLLQTGQLPALYYSLDPGDSDRLVFLEHLLTALSRNAPGNTAGESSVQLHQLLDYVRSGRNVPDQLVTATVVNCLERRGELFIMLDDYHQLPAGSMVHRLLSQLIDRLPAHAHLVIASRAEPALPGLAALRMKGEVYDVTPECLAVTPADLQSLSLASGEAALPPQSLNRLLEVTEGWVTGVRMVLQAAGRDHRVGLELDQYLREHRTLFEYFAAEIFATLPAAARDFLVRCSVLDHLDPQACAAVAGAPDAGDLLAGLSRRNMFVARAGDGYRCHGLFREFLRSRIGGPGECRRLNGAAARWFLARGDTLPAVEHLLEAGQFQDAARAMAPIVETVFSSARFELVERWLSRLPLELVEQSPALLLGRAALHRFKNDQQARRNDLESALRTARNLKDRNYQVKLLIELGGMAFDQRRLPEAMRLTRAARRLGLKRGQRIMAGIDVLICLCHTLTGRFAAAERACRAIPRGMVQLFGAAIPVHDNYLCITLTRSGKIAEALERYRQIVPKIEPTALSHPKTCMFLMDAITAALYHGSSALARQWLELMRQASPLSDATALLHRTMSISMLVQDGRLAEAANITRRLLEEPDRLSRWGFPAQAGFLQAWLVNIDYYSGDYRSSARRLQRCQSDGGEVFKQLQQLFREAMLASLTRRRADAARCCHRIACQPANPYRDLLLSLARSASAGRPAAMRHLRRAVDIAGWYGLDGKLAVEVRYHPQLKRLLPECGAPAAQIRALRELIDARPSSNTDGPVRISLFGTLMVSAPDRTQLTLAWQGYKAASLLGFLLLHRGRYFTKEDLVRQLWPGVAPARSFNRLFATISRLNTAVGRLVAHDTAGYSIAADDAMVSLDADEFTECHRLAVAAATPPERRLDAIRRCLALYRGPLLQSVGDAWAEPFRHGFHAKYLQVLRAAVEAEAARDNWSASTEAARRIVDAEPGNELAATALLTGLGKMGLRTDMVRSFTQICRRLRAQRRPPSPVMLREYQRLLG